MWINLSLHSVKSVALSDQLNSANSQESFLTDPCQTVWQIIDRNKSPHSWGFHILERKCFHLVRKEMGPVRLLSKG